MHRQMPLGRRAGILLERAVLSAALAALFSTPALAFENPEASPDLEMRRGNTLRYNVGGHS